MYFVHVYEFSDIVASKSGVLFPSQWTQMMEGHLCEQFDRVREDCWEAFCQMMDSQRPNDLCRLLKHQSGCHMLGGSIYLSFIKPYPERRAETY